MRWPRRVSRRAPTACRPRPTGATLRASAAGPTTCPVSARRPPNAPPPRPPRSRWACRSPRRRLRDYRPVVAACRRRARARRPPDRRHLQRESAVDGGGAAHTARGDGHRAADAVLGDMGELGMAPRRTATGRGGAARHRPAVRGGLARRVVLARARRRMDASALHAGVDWEETAQRVPRGPARATGYCEGIPLDAHGAHRRAFSRGAGRPMPTTRCTRSHPSSGLQRLPLHHVPHRRATPRRCSSRSGRPAADPRRRAAARRPGDPRGRARAPGAWHATMAAS